MPSYFPSSCIAITYGEILIKQISWNCKFYRKKAVRIATGSPLRSNTDNMYKCSGIMKLDCINTYLVGKVMYKVYHKIIPAICDDFFKYNYHIHDHYTRTANHLHVSLTGTNLSKTGIRYQGVIIWNNRKWQDYVYIQCEYKSTKQKIKHLLREENKVKENKIS